MKAKQMPAGQFKAHCLAVMDRVMKSGEPVVVTKHGKPMVKVMPAHRKKDDIFDYMAGRAKIVGDIVAPTATDDWECK